MRFLILLYWPIHYTSRYRSVPCTFQFTTNTLPWRLPWWTVLLNSTLAWMILLEVTNGGRWIRQSTPKRKERKIVTGKIRRCPGCGEIIGEDDPQGAPVECYLCGKDVHIDCATEVTPLNDDGPSECPCYFCPHCVERIVEAAGESEH